MKKNKSGRPSKYDTIDLNKLRQMAEIGLTDVQMSKLLNISRESLSKYKKRKEFFDTLKKGKAVSDEKVERSLFERACGYEHEEDKVFCHDGKIITCRVIKHYPPDPVSMIFWLKNRKPEQWKDKQTVEHDVADKLAEKLKEAKSRIKR